jgi:hypothetical protein
LCSLGIFVFACHQIYVCTSRCRQFKWAS